MARGSWLKRRGETVSFGETGSFAEAPFRFVSFRPAGANPGGAGFCQNDTKPGWKWLVFQNRFDFFGFD